MTIKGFKTKFQLYTVPGQVIYNTTRQLVLRGVDGIVFFADSQYEKMEENIESFQNLADNLALKLNLDDIPYVLQYNKRDLPNAAPVEYMEFLLNNREVQVPSFVATAHLCEGVFETLNMITRLLLNKFITQYASNAPQYVRHGHPAPTDRGGHPAIWSRPARIHEPHRLPSRRSSSTRAAFSSPNRARRRPARRHDHRALASGAFLANQTIANLVHETNFNSVYQQGEKPACSSSTWTSIAYWS